MTKRMTLKSPAELIAEKRLSSEIASALQHSREAAEYHAKFYENILQLAFARNHLLARSEDTSEVDAEIKATLAERRVT